MCAMFSNTEVIGTLDIGPNVDIVFSVLAYREQYYASIRKFQHTPRYDGPTKAGLVLRCDLLDWLIEQLQDYGDGVPLLHLELGEIARVQQREGIDIVIQTMPASLRDGGYRIDIRKHVQNAGYVGPTKKGIRFGLSDLSQVLNLLRAQSAKIKQMETARPNLFRPVLGEEPQPNISIIIPSAN